MFCSPERVAILDDQLDQLSTDNLRQREKISLLIHLLKYGENSLAYKFLREKGVDANGLDWRGNSPLFLASVTPHPHYPLVDTLLKNTANINIRPPNKNLFLIDYVVARGNTELIRKFFTHPSLVVDRPAPVSGIDDYPKFKSPIFYANDQPTFDLLKSLGLKINTVAKDGTTPLSFALEESDEKIALLLANGTDPEYRFPFSFKPCM